MRFMKVPRSNLLGLRLDFNLDSVMALLTHLKPSVFISHRLGLAYGLVNSCLQHIVEEEVSGFRS